MLAEDFIKTLHTRKHRYLFLMVTIVTSESSVMNNVCHKKTKLSEHEKSFRGSTTTEMRVFVAGKEIIDFTKR